MLVNNYIFNTTLTTTTVLNERMYLMTSCLGPLIYLLNSAYFSKLFHDLSQMSAQEFQCEYSVLLEFLGCIQTGSHLLPSLLAKL